MATLPNDIRNPYGTGGIIFKTKPGCGACPQSVLDQLNARVYGAVQCIQRLKYTTSMFNRFLRDVASLLVEELNRILAAIPEPPVLDLSQVLGYYACPLTPSAIADQYLKVIMEAGPAGWSRAIKKAPPIVEDADPRRMWQLTVSLIQEQARQITRLVDTLFGLYDAYTPPQDALTYQALVSPPGTLVAVKQRAIYVDSAAATGTDGYRLIRPANEILDKKPALALVRRYVVEVYRIVEDAPKFVVTLIAASAHVSVVKALCPDVYNSDAYAFKAFEEEMHDWSFDGVLPSNLDAMAKDAVTVAMQIQAKVLAWATAATLIV
jgi:hypothetical protein